MHLLGSARVVFAAASASLAVLSLAYGDSVLMGQSVPAWMPWRETWVYGAAVVLLIAGAALCCSRTAAPGALTTGACLAVWAGTCTPQIASNPLSFGGWYGFCEAMTSLAGAWILYALLQEQPGGSQAPLAGARAVRAAQVLFGLTCVFYGSSHFAYAGYTASMVPDWLPGHLGLAYFTGLAHIAAGAGLVLGIQARAAAALETLMMSLFGLLVWVPSFFALPRPTWAGTPPNQWSELVVNLVLAAAAWVVTVSLIPPADSNPPMSS